MFYYSKNCILRTYKFNELCVLFYEKAEHQFKAPYLFITCDIYFKQ